MGVSTWAGTPRQVHPLGRYTPRADTPPPEQCVLGDTGNKRAVRILLECILVFREFSSNRHQIIIRNNLMMIYWQYNKNDRITKWVVQQKLLKFEFNSVDII